MAEQRRHVLAGDLEWMEYAIADYIRLWGRHLDGVDGSTIAGLPCAVANMAMTVIRKNIVATWDEPIEVLTPDEHAARLARSSDSGGLPRQRGDAMSRRTQVRGRGFCAIGIERGKTHANVGTLWRSAVCLGADFIFVIGPRYPRQASDTVASWRHVPMFEYADLSDFLTHRPLDVPLVGVELTEGARPLETFVHPERALYLLGPEDGNLSKRAQDACQHVVQFESAYCLNVAAAGSVVLYDRQAKLVRAGERVG